MVTRPRRLWAALVSVAVVVSALVVSPTVSDAGEPDHEAQASGFTDVPATHPFIDEITWLVDEGVTTGFTDGTFRSVVPVSRQAMAAFLFRYSNTGVATAPPCTAAPFTDVAVTHPFCGEIAWLANTGITTGFDDGSFDPTADVSRQAMAAFLYRFTQKTGANPPDCTTAPFIDVAVTHPFCGEITWLADTGITTGFDDGSFRSGSAVSRQAIAAFLFRVGDLGTGVNQLAHEAVVVDDADLDFTQFEPEGTSTFSYTGAEPLGVGTVVIVDTATGPFYGRVTVVNGNQFTTGPATLMDVIPNLDLSMTVDTETGQVDIASLDGSGPAVAVEPIDTSDVPSAMEPASGSVTCETGSGMTITPEVGVGAGQFILDAHWEPFRGIDHLEVAFTPRFDADLHAGVTAAAKCSYQQALATVNLPVIRFAIGPVPVVITHKIELSVDAEVDLEGVATIDAGFSAQGRLGTRYDNGTFALVNTVTTDRTLTPDLDLEATASLAVPVTYSARAYGMLGFDVGAGPKVALTVRPLDNTWLTLDASVEGSIALLVELAAGPITFRKSHTFGPQIFWQERLVELRRTQHQFALGHQHSCALIDGVVHCWGENAVGQLGIGTIDSGNHLLPAPVPNLTDVRQLATRYQHTCAVLGDATARCWGLNNFGQVGDGTQANQPAPVPVGNLTGVTRIATGIFHSCGLIDDGTVKCWGVNSSGQLGTGSVDAVATANPVVPVSGLTGVTQIVAGATHTCACCWVQGPSVAGEPTRRASSEAEVPCPPSNPHPRWSTG